MKQTVTVLLVEDSDTDTEIVKRVLTNRFTQQYTLLRAQSMLEARALLKSDFCSIDIILLDLGLPDTDGRRDTFKQLGEANVNNLPVVILTSSEDQGLAFKIVNWGAQYYICKSQIVQNSKSLPETIEFSLCRHNHKTQLKQAANAKLAEKNQVLQWMGGGYSCSG
jgi:DNA-binding response OmpR family regulator